MIKSRVKKTCKYLSSVLVLCFCLILVDLVTEYYQLNQVNQSPLTIHTFDGSDSPYHPSVKYFPTPWNGYNYWMAETPFSPKTLPYRDRNECPCIHISKDGLHWKDYDNDKNPIDNFGKEGELNFDYFSDPHLVVNGDTLECWYRLTQRHGMINDISDVCLYRKQSTDGIHWSARKLMMNCTKFQEKEIVSPVIIKNDRGYNMWVVDNDKLFLYCQDDSHGWKKEKCYLDKQTIKPWHIDILEDGNIYWLVCYGNNELSLWSSVDKTHFSFIKTILKPSDTCGSFYQAGLYRSSLVKAKPNHYRLYFSAYNYEQTFIGVMEGTNPKCLKVISTENKFFCDFTFFLNNYFQSRYRSLHFILTHLSYN